MFRFFTQGKWLYWSWAGSFIILFSLWFQVQIDVKINNWFGQFYDMIQKALSAPNSITIEEYWASLFSFYYISSYLCWSCCSSWIFYITLSISMENSNG